MANHPSKPEWAGIAAMITAVVAALAFVNNLFGIGGSDTNTSPSGSSTSSTPGLVITAEPPQRITGSVTIFNLMYVQDMKDRILRRRRCPVPADPAERDLPAWKDEHGDFVSVPVRNDPGADFTEADPIIVRDEKHEVIGSGKLGKDVVILAGKIDASKSSPADWTAFCQFPFTVTVSPRASYYQFEIGGKESPVAIAHTDLDRMGWRVSLDGKLKPTKWPPPSCGVPTSPGCGVNYNTPG